MSTYNEYKKLLQSFQDIPYYENINSPLYLSMYIGRYVQNVFNAKFVSKLIPTYWKIRRGGEELKVKHVSACLGINAHSLYWEYNIEHNQDIDGFILSAFSDIECLEPEHIWFMSSKTKFQTKVGKKEFWDRSKFRVYDTEKMIKKMSKYELTYELGELKKVMNIVRQDLEKGRDSDIRRMILDKKNDIYMTTGNKISIKNIIEQAIRSGICNVK